MVIVSTEHAEIRDIVSDGLNSLVFEISNIDTLYKSLLNLTTDQIKDIQSINRAAIKKNYSQARFEAKIAKWYWRILTK